MHISRHSLPEQCRLPLQTPFWSAMETLSSGGESSQGAMTAVGCRRCHHRWATSAHFLIGERGARHQPGSNVIRPVPIQMKAFCRTRCARLFRATLNVSRKHLLINCLTLDILAKQALVEHKTVYFHFNQFLIKKLRVVNACTNHPVRQ